MMHASLKKWEWPGNEATIIILHDCSIKYLVGRGPSGHAQLSNTHVQRDTWSTEKGHFEASHERILAGQVIRY